MMSEREKRNAVILKRPRLWSTVTWRRDSSGKYIPRDYRTDYYVADLLDMDSLGNIAIWFQITDEEIYHGWKSRAPQ